MFYYEEESAERLIAAIKDLEGLDTDAYMNGLASIIDNNLSGNRLKKQIASFTLEEDENVLDKVNTLIQDYTDLDIDITKIEYDIFASQKRVEEKIYLEKKHV